MSDTEMDHVPQGDEDPGDFNPELPSRNYLIEEEEEENDVGSASAFGASSAGEPKKEEPKKVEPKKEEPKKVEPKKEEPKKVEPKKEEPKKPEPKKEEPKKEEPKKQPPPKQTQPKPQQNGKLEDDDDGFQFHKAFRGKGKVAGLDVWRIEHFEPVPQDPKTHGQFYNGDAYIVLNTKTVGSGLHYDIHFWLGKNCAQDEAGSAAILSVELDVYLGEVAVQHREVQGHESKLFLGLFKKGIKYLEGGVKSGFNKIEDLPQKKRLYQCKGKHTVRVEQVEVKCASLNQSDVFILEDGPQMYVWIGPKSSRMERVKGTEMARQIRDDEKAGKAKITIIETEWETHTEFFKALGKKDKVIKTADPLDDAEMVRKLDQEITLYKVFKDPKMNKYDYKEVSVRPLSMKMLESENCYALDSGYSGLFLWTGKDSPLEIRAKVWTAVNDFIDARGYPSWVQVERVVDGAESPVFKQYFPDWDDGSLPVPGTPTSGSNVAKQSYEQYDAKEMHKKATDVDNYMPDDGKGKMQVWRVVNFELKPVPPKAYGIFFGGDCYVIQYDYKDEKGRDAHIIYFWQGLKSDNNDRGSSALHAMRLDDELGGEAVQIRVVMNKEPAHFLKLFKGHLLYFMGGHITGYRNIHDNDQYKKDEPLMFHIRGNDEDHVRAIQVPARAASLNSNDVFIVDTEKKTYGWKGKFASENELKMAAFMLKYISPAKGDPALFEEGKETMRFWDDIGGKEPYYTGMRRQDSVKIETRLFHCSNSSGKFTVEEICNFTQEDLDTDDVMMLDTYEEVFIWVGKGANEFEKKESYRTAYNYLQSDPTGRNQDNTLIIVVRQGFEPPQFRGHFHPWDSDLWNHGKTFDEIIAEIGKENAGINILEKEVEKYFATYTLEELQRRVPPEGVDVKQREQYLSDEEFKSVFKMTKEQFEDVPEWKRVNMKKQVNLF